MTRRRARRRISFFWIALLLALGLTLLVRGLDLYGHHLARLSHPRAAAAEDRAAAAAPMPAATVSVPVRVPDAPLTLVDFQPLQGRGSWAIAEERQPAPSCARLAATEPDPEPNSWGIQGHLRWRETCGEPPAPTRVTLRGSGFASPASANRVRFGDVPAVVVAGDEQQLVVEPGGGPPLARITVETPPAADGSPRRATLPRPFVLIGPPRRLELVGGDGQSARAGSALEPIAVRVVDARGTPVPGERVWFWVHSRERRRKLEDPIFLEAVSDDEGVATAAITLGETPALLTVEATVVNLPRGGPRRVGSVFAQVEALPASDQLASLIAELDGVDEERRREAARALAGLGPTARAAVPALVAASRHSDPELRWRAAEALHRLGAREALEALVRIVREPRTYRRQEAAMLLGDFRDRAGEVLPTLVAVVEEAPAGSNFAERLAALDAIGRLGPQAAAAAVPAVVRVLDDERPDLRKLAIQTLWRLRPPAEDVAPALRARLDDENVGVAREARRALESAFGGVAPPRLEPVAGAETTVATGDRFEIAVRLLDHEGRPRSGERVYFDGSGSGLELESASALTGESGVCRVQATARRPGTYRVTTRFGSARASVSVTVRGR